MEDFPKNQIRIRHFADGDTDLVIDFFQNLSESTRYFLHSYSFTEDKAVKFSSEELENHDVQKYLAVLTKNEQEIMVGHVIFWSWSKMVPWLGIAVREGYQGMRLGTLLLEFAINEAKRALKGGILLTTMADNVRGQALYKRCVIDTIGNDPKGEYLMLLNFE